jgi:hypothetical protein
MIIAKVLANRLKVILDDIISTTQAAFVPGRSITDNVVVGFESIHSMKRKGTVALKVDISKAYDRVKWDYLQAIMMRMGFSSDWVQLIMLCVSRVTYYACLNGHEVGPIKPFRGLRQGDPLSPTFSSCAVRASPHCFKRLKKEVIYMVLKCVEQLHQCHTCSLLMTVFSSSTQMLKRLVQLSSCLSSVSWIRVRL